MLLSCGYAVTFFEKTTLKPNKTKNHVKGNINLIRHYELLHHQLKPFGILIKLNQIVVKYFIKKNTRNNDVNLIINFIRVTGLNKNQAKNKSILPERR